MATLAFIAVALLAGQVGPGSPIAQLDETLAKALDRNRTPGLHRFFQHVTLMGTGWAIGIASGIVGLFLLIRRRFAFAVGWGITQLGAVTLVKLIKAMVERTRPGLGDTTFYAHGWSFPSGHVVRTFAFCAMGTYVVYRLTGSRFATTVAGVVGILWSLTMAFSRLYLGAHFASDVIAGLVVGTGWVAVCIAGMEEAHRRAGAFAGDGASEA